MLTWFFIQQMLFSCHVAVFFLSLRLSPLLFDAMMYCMVNKPVYCPFRCLLLLLFRTNFMTVYNFIDFTGCCFFFLASKSIVHFNVAAMKWTETFLQPFLWSIIIFNCPKVATLKQLPSHRTISILNSIFMFKMVTLLQHTISIWDFFFMYYYVRLWYFCVILCVFIRFNILFCAFIDFQVK